MPESETHTLLVDIQTAKTEYPRDKTVYQLFEEQMKRTPDQAAVIYGEKQFTYRQLNERANQLARTLRKRGKDTGSLQLFASMRSNWSGILAVLKAGGICAN
nr:AMP-binding protein [Bacillus velezensis]